MLVPVEELQRDDLLGQVRRSEQRPQIAEVQQARPMPALVLGRLTGCLQRQRDRLLVAGGTSCFERDPAPSAAAAPGSVRVRARARAAVSRAAVAGASPGKRSTRSQRSVSSATRPASQSARAVTVSI
jgi:hypothetical protein